MADEFTLDQLYGGSGRADPGSPYFGGSKEAALQGQLETLAQERKQFAAQPELLASLDREEARLRGTKVAGPGPIKPARTIVFSLDDLYPPQVETPVQQVLGGVKAAGKAVAREAAGLADMLLAIPGGAASSIAELGFRALTSADPSIGQVSAAEAGRGFREYIAEHGSPTWFTDVLNKVAPPDQHDNPTVVARAMNLLQETIDKGGSVVDKATGGKINKDDVSMFVNGALNMVGLKAGLSMGKARAAAPELPPEPSPISRPPVEPVIAPAGPALPRPPTKVAAEAVEPRFPDQAGDLTGALEKLREGRRRDLTPEEQVALRGAGMRGAVDHRILAAAGLGGAGIMLANQFPDAQEALLGGALLGGMLIPKAGRGLSFEELRAMPEGRALGPILAESKYSLKTLDNLPANRVEFPKKMVEEQLRREGVTAAEKAVVTSALAGVAGNVISAKDLVAGVKQATGDFELSESPTHEFARYGLEAIGRYDEAGGFGGGNPTVPAKTSVWQLPDTFSGDIGNHFKNPRYFGHTRSFEEGGVRHVVEIQSDLAQRAAKPLDEAQVRELTASSESIRRQKELIDNARSQPNPKHWVDLLLEENPDAGLMMERNVQRFGFEDFDHAISMMPKNAEARTAVRYSLEVLYSGLNSRLAENGAKLNRNGELAQLAPMLKDWPKRLIREELAANVKKQVDLRQRAQEFREYALTMPDGTPEKEMMTRSAIAAELEAPKRDVARFATADTVAKVEGWGDKHAQALREIAEADAAQVEALKPGGGRYGAYAPRILDQIAEGRKEWEAILQEPRFRPEHQGIYDRYRRDIEKFLRQLGGKEVTDASGHTWIEVPSKPAYIRPQMFGGASETLMRTLGSVGVGAVIGAYLGGDDRVTGAVLGAVGGLLGVYAASRSRAVRNMASEAVDGLDKYAGLVSTRVINKSPVIHHRLVKHEQELRQRAYDQLETTAPFITSLGKIPRRMRPMVDSAILSNDPARILQAFRATGIAPLVSEWQTVRGLLDSIGKDLQGVGLLRSLRPDYFPRSVKDLPGLYEYLGKEAGNDLGRIISAAEAQAVKTTGLPLTDLQRSAIVNKYLQGRLNEPRNSSSFLKGRTLQQFEQGMLPFYETPVESLTGYIRSTTRAVAKAKFFGKDLAKAEKDGVEYVDTDSSVGALVDREARGGKLSPADVEELKVLLKARFEGGEKVGHRGLQAAKDLTIASILAHPTNAVLNLADLGTNLYTQGFLPGIQGAASALLPRVGLSAKQMGLLEHAVEELNTTALTARYVRGAMKLSGFTALDALGKNSSLNAALANYRSLSKSPQGQAVIKARYEKAFGEDTAQLLADLRAGKNTELVKTLALHELSRTQPWSKIEVPQAYLENPNGRLVYTLKTFMLKQMDLLRREAYNEIKAGRPLVGAKNLVALGLVWGIGNAVTSWVRDWMLGRDVNPQPSDITENMLKTFGVSDYLLNKAKKEPVQAALGMVAPPVQVADEIYSTAKKIAAGEVKRPTDMKGAQNIPVAGRLIYNRALGGAEAADKAKAKRERQAQFQQLMQRYKQGASQ